MSPEGLASRRSNLVNASMISTASNARLRFPTVICFKTPASTRSSIARDSPVAAQRTSASLTPQLESTHVAKPRIGFHPVERGAHNPRDKRIQSTRAFLRAGPLRSSDCRGEIWPLHDPLRGSTLLETSNSLVDEQPS